jgi:hypothetical protein
MIEFSRVMLELLAEFLSTEPVFYLYGMVIFLFIVKICMTIMRKN